MDLPVIGPVLKKIFGSANDRMVARYLRLAKQVSELESSVRPLTDSEIQAKTGEFRSRLADGASISELTPEIFAVAREAMDRAVGIRAIFDPERGFDPSTLPENVQSLYAETKAAMDAAEAMAELERRVVLFVWSVNDPPRAVDERVGRGRACPAALRLAQAAVDLHAHVRHRILLLVHLHLA